MGEHSAQLPLLIVLLIAAAASIALNIGKAVQKMKVEVLKKGKLMLRPPHRRDFFIWCVGISLTFIAGLLTMIAQGMTDKTSLVSSLNGVGLIGLAIFAHLVLKEKVGLRECSAIAMIAIGTAAVAYFNVASKTKVYNFDAMLWCVGICTLLFTLLLVGTKVFNKGRAFVYAATAGAFLGLMNIFYHIGPIAAGAGFSAQFSTPYPYIGFLLLGNMGFVMTNLAFFHGTGITVVPTVNSFLMITPLIFEIFIFDTVLAPAQYAGAAAITAGLIILTTGMERGATAASTAAAA